MKIKVLWHLPFAMIGGVETLYAVILKYIDKENFDHYISCHRAIEPWVSNKFRSYAKVITWGNDDDLALSLKSINPTVIMGTHGKTLYDAIEKTERYYPVIECVHGSHIWSEHNVYMPKTYTKHVICVSSSAERVYLENTSSSAPTSIIINGIDTEVFHPFRPLQRQSKIIAYSGRFLESDKHIKKIIKAFGSLVDFQARLHLIGGQPAEIVHLNHFTRSLKMANRIKFFGHTDKPEKHLHNVDIFTVRSEAEGYCNSVAEALAAGIPCVCYNFGGILDHVPPGTIAVAKSQPEYAKLLSEVHRDFSRRKEMREKGLLFIQTQGNAQTMCNRYEEVIKAIVNNTSVPEIRPQKRKHSNSINMNTGDSELILPSVSVRNKEPVIGVCNFSWHGIATATKNICDEVVGWHQDPNIIVKNIVQKNPRAILFSGMCPGFDKAAELLKEKYPKYPVYAYYHGGASHYSFKSGLFGDGERNAFRKMIDLHKIGYFKKIAVSSPGFAETLRANGIDAKFCGNLVSKIDFNRNTAVLKDGIHIGSWNRNHDHKHTSIVIAASQLIDKSTVHCLSGYPDIPGYETKQIRPYTEMPQELLYNKYAQMTVNTQMSFIETCNISVLEMWASGRPVVVGPGNYALYANNEFLRTHCLVVDHTNPVAVAYAIQKVVSMQELVIKYQFDELQKISSEVKARWGEFFL